MHINNKMADETQQFELSIEDYDEVEDAYEIRASRENYERESANLLAKIGERDELVKLLKIAQPEKIAELRELITRYDKYIEDTEEIVAIQYSIYQSRIDYWKQMTELEAMSDVIRPALLKHVAEHNPEKLEELEAMLSGDDKTH